MLAVIHASVVDQPVDAIVNAANAALAGGGGVDAAIHDAAGPELDLACRAIGHCNTSEAVITPSFNLQRTTGARHIIHTVGPIYARYSRKRNAELLEACYHNSCELALESNDTSLAFCSISTGVYGYPAEDALPIAISTLFEYADFFDPLLFCLYTASEYRRGVSIINCIATTHQEGDRLIIDAVK